MLMFFRMEEWDDLNVPLLKKLTTQDEDCSQGKMEDTELDHSGLEDDDVLPAHTSQKLKRSMSFYALKDTEVANESTKLVEETMQLCNLSSHATGNICSFIFNGISFYSPAIFQVLYFELTDSRWNKEKLIEDFLDNSDKVLEKAGITSFDVGSQKIMSADKSQECLICLETYSPSDLFSLTCGHFYCKSCWKEYLEVT